MRFPFRVAFAAGLTACVLMPAQAAAQRASFEELQTFSAVMNHIRINYVDSVSYTPLVRSAIAGALASLDPHSRYVRMEASNILEEVARGEVASVGLVLDDGEDGAYVAAVGAGSAAERAGVLALDRVVAVADTPTTGMGAKDVEARLAGAGGSTVRLTVARGAASAPQRVTVRLKRSKYVWPAVSASMLLDSTTGYVRFNEFTPGSAKEVEKAVKSVQKSGATRLIMDLRGNPGGVVVEAVSIASLFLPDNYRVFSTDGRTTTSDTTYNTTRNGPFTKIPLIVMIDGGSASASEALAAALQDHDRALLVGHRSFGKALVQAPLVLPAGDMLWLTIARVVSPSGRVIQRSYRDLTSGQYRELAGTASGGSAPSFKSTSGRPLEAAGGVVPDVSFGERPDVPPWWTMALDSAIDQQVVRDASNALDASVTTDAWSGMTQQWDALLLAPFMTEAGRRFKMDTPDPQLRRYLARMLALRLAESRWGNDAAARMRMVTDPEIIAALAKFEALSSMLRPAR